VNLGSGVHLTYCSNIHAGETWEEVQQALARHVPRVRDRLAPGARLGIGLRLSAQAADALAQPGQLAAFKAFLQREDLYVFTLNGFPHGAFHGTAVKEAVYRPDWRSAERVRYSCVLADLLAELLPAEPGLEGSVSTVPGAYKAEVRGAADVDAMRENIVRVAAHLVALERRTGRRITLALEPEPCCLLETVDETLAFFRDHQHAGAAAAQLAALAGLDAAGAARALRAHLGVCLDLCHAAVEFEDPARCAEAFAAAGIGVFKMQVSAGLAIARFDAATRDALGAYVDPVYLHQVVERRGGTLRRFADLPPALATWDDAAGRDEWRVHFHVPVFHDDLGAFRSTRGFIVEMLRRQRARPVSRHLEVETYTWDVLPPALRATSVDEAIARELAWVQGELRA
jgi:sugar phosphate isomerase/epimerase